MPEDKRNSRLNAGIFADVPAFVRGLTFADLPADVVEQARRCLLDLIGGAAAGSRTRAAQIVNDYAATLLRSSEMEGWATITACITPVM
jgi:2-methylcitrate dehydratase PrpD